MAEERGSCHLRPAGEELRKQNKRAHLHPLRAVQDAEKNNEGGEARGLDKGISVYLVLLPGASARQAQSGDKQHHVSSVSPSLQEPSSFFIQQVFIEL